MQAVVKIQGSQYLVSEGEELLVNNLGDQKDLVFNDVLMLINGNTVDVGKPNLDGTVSATNLGSVKGEKIRVSKYKAKSRYRRTVGFRSKLNKIRIEKIAVK